MKFTPEEAIEFTKRSVALLVSWPPPINLSKTKLFLVDAYFLISLLDNQLSLIVTVYGIFAHDDSQKSMILCVCSVAVLQTSIKMTVCRIKRSDLQSIVQEMENVLKQALPHEREILKKYVDRIAMLHMTLTFGFYISVIMGILGPVFLPQPLPSFAVYPFDVEYHPVYEIIYFHQSYTGLMLAAGSAVDCQVATLLWFAGARFEMLKDELLNVVDEYDLKRCVAQHQRILRYAEDVIKAVRFLILVTVGVTAMLIVFSGVVLLFTDSAMIKIQFVIVNMVAITQLFVNSYPAENLLEMSNAVGSAAYHAEWIGKSKKMWTTMCILIQRSQKPIIISVSGFLPALSLTYYMSFLSSSFSYFTTMRAMVQ